MPKQISAAERAQRLIALLGRLTPDSRHRIADLADELGTTEQELFDDLNTLAVCGVAPYGPDSLVPLLFDDGWVWVWQDLPSLRRPVRLSAGEARALATALQSAGFGEDDPLPKRLLAAAASASFDADTFASTLRADTAAHDATVFETISNAAADRAVVAIDYVRVGDTALTCRDIEPLALSLDRGVWYVRAWCRQAEGWRTFRIDRIRSARTTRQHFDARDSDETPGGLLDRDLPSAVLVFDQADGYSQRDWPGSSVLESHGGGARVSVPYSGTGWIARQVVARLGAVRVESPAEVREAVSRLAESMLSERG